MHHRLYPIHEYLTHAYDISLMGAHCQSFEAHCQASSPITLNIMWRAARNPFPQANSKALAEKEGDGMAKMMYNKKTGEILGVHIIGLHAADLIHEASNAIATKQSVQDIKFNVHAHPTLSEVLDELFKMAHIDVPAKVPVGAK